MPGFYKGLAPYLLHVMPNICLVMIIYEKFANTWYFDTSHTKPHEIASEHTTNVDEKQNETDPI